MTTGCDKYLEKDFFLVSGGDETVHVGSTGLECAIVIDAEGEEVAYAPKPYALLIAAALNAYGPDEFGIDVPVSP